MNVKLISVTKPIIEIKGEEINADELIVYIARVSNPGNQDNMETAPKLLSYLARKKHVSPFEMADMCVEIKTSRAIAAQILRHRSFSFQEFSQRYARAEESEYIHLRKQAETNRQSSTETMDDPKDKLARMVSETVNHSFETYEKLLDAGVAKECARMVLPLATTTTLYMKGSVRSWIHYLMQRTKPDAQREHRDVAEQIELIFAAEFPNVYAAMKEI